MIPDTDQFQYNFRVCAAPLYLSVLLALLFYYFYTGYVNSANSFYLATLDSYKEDSNGGPTCSYIPVTITGNFMATQSGQWESMPSFSNSDALYNLQTKNLGITKDEYIVEMKRLRALMTVDAEIMVQRDLGYNILLLMNRVYPLFDTTQRFSYTADVSDVFKRDFTNGVMAGVFGRCEIPSSTTFNYATATISTTYSFSSFISDTTCTKVTDPKNLLYDFYADPPGDDFTVSVDVKSLTVAMSINLGINKLENLYETPDVLSTMTFNSTDSYTNETISVYMSSYYQPEYVGMKPLTCLTITVRQEIHYSELRVYISKIYCTLSHSLTY